MKRSLYIKILVPLDGSEQSQKALTHACDLAKNYKGDLILLYVVEKSPINLLDKKEYLNMLQKFGDKVLAKAQRLVSQNGLDAKLVMKEGNIVNEISKLAKKEKCNLIVVGNKGLGATARFFLGSVSNKLANSSPCSILIVK